MAFQTQQGRAHAQCIHTTHIGLHGDLVPVCGEIVDSIRNSVKEWHEHNSPEPGEEGREGDSFVRVRKFRLGPL